MRIKEVIIDGFKSYANRTVISGWDPSFNAITGLNGSGKSNILDAICFNLGITNLSQVRARNQQELVYKRGQSGVTKASVTIVFDNSDTKSSPVGYEQHKEIHVARQIVINGRSKYLINGHQANQSRVQNLFHSVALNVNNPHFLIMQGMITKVVNMKPPEILGMMEEAAGTRMYETKKLAARKTIAKKQTKVEEIQKILVEDIQTTLEKLRKEKSSFLRWSSNNTDIERSERFLIAYNFQQANETMAKSVELVQGLGEKKQDYIDANENLQEQLEDNSQQIRDLEAQKAKESEELTGLEQEVDAFAKKLVQRTSAWQHQKDSIASETKTRNSVAKGIEELNKNIAKTQEKEEKTAVTVKKLEEEQQELTTRLANLEGQQLGFDAGSGDSDNQGSLHAQLMNAQKEKGKAQSDAKQAATKAKHLKKTIGEKKKGMKKMSKDQSKLISTQAAQEKKLAAVNARLDNISFDAEEKEEVENRIEILEETHSTLKDQVEKLDARLQRLQFEYRSPSANFDRSKVKGLVAKLFNVEDAKTATALEITAGGKLYNVVVDNQQTGKQLLEKGRLKRRVTIIPLNKIASREIQPKVIKRAEDLVGKENVSTALSLVGYDEEVEAAMRYVFGKTFICKDAKTAERVTFDRQIRCRSVTLAGDLFDPQGTLTGGSAPKGGSILAQLQQLNTIENRYQEATAELKQLKKKLATMNEAEEELQQLNVDKELLLHELTLTNTRLESSSFAHLKRELDELEAEVKECSEQQAHAKEMERKAIEQIEELETSIRDFESERKTKLKQIEKDMAKAKKSLVSSTKKMKEAKSDLETLTMEIGELNSELKSMEGQLEEAERRINDMEQEETQLLEAMSIKKSAYEEAKANLDKERERVAACDVKMSQIKQARNALSKQLGDNNLEIKKITHKIARTGTDQKEAAEKVQLLYKRHDWIESEQHLFGKPHTDYDFEKSPPAEVQARLQELKEEQEGLSKKINKKVMGMFEKAEQEAAELIEKRDIIEKDKEKIEQVIAELDRKKNEALDSTWRKVNKDFGSVFSTLLPGAFAQLAPPEGKTVLDGLEVKVSFGGVWKESLTELSGGQRSLLALSLILAMLLYKPAPFYILDEIDAALDLSHTQNIGTMLKTHFPQSQFIVVSLKDGMFNNANVLFRTKFVEGVSTVKRTTLAQTSRKKSTHA